MLRRSYGGPHPKIQTTLKKTVAATLYRITIEAVRNAIRHGTAEHVDVSAKIDGNTLIAEVRDDGIGFDPSQVAKDRFGLRAMDARARLVGGQLTVDSTPGGPTIIRLNVPMRSKG